MALAYFLLEVCQSLLLLLTRPNLQTRDLAERLQTGLAGAFTKKEAASESILELTKTQRQLGNT